VSEPRRTRFCALRLEKLLRSEEAKPCVRKKHASSIQALTQTCTLAYCLPWRAPRSGQKVHYCGASSGRCPGRGHEAVLRSLHLALIPVGIHHSPGISREIESRCDSRSAVRRRLCAAPAAAPSLLPSFSAVCPSPPALPGGTGASTARGAGGALATAWGCRDRMSAPDAAVALAAVADSACSALTSEACELARASLAPFRSADALWIKLCALSRHSLRHAVTSAPCHGRGYMTARRVCWGSRCCTGCRAVRRSSST